MAAMEGSLVVSGDCSSDSLKGNLQPEADVQSESNVLNPVDLEKLGETGSQPASFGSEKDCKELNDPYSYLNRGDYTTELYKLELMNLPKQFGIAQLKKKLVFLGLNPCKIKTVDRGHYAFVTFRNEEEREKAISVLNGHVWKNKPIKVKKAQPAADPLLLKRKQVSADEDNQANCKLLRLNDQPSSTEAETKAPAERLNEAVTPLWQVPYSEQLQKKDALIAKLIKELGKEIEKNNKPDANWLQQQRSINDGFCCKVYNIKQSPMVNNYRNKCEFTVGRSMNGADNVVGFRLGSYRNGDLSILEPTDCIHIPDSMKKITQTLQRYLQQSDKTWFNPVTRQGHWQTAVVRTTCRGSNMLTVVLHPQNLTVGELAKEKSLLKKFFEEVNEKEELVASLYLKIASDRQTDGNQSYDVLLGDTYITEDLLGMKFQISPDAFFQVNTAAAEVLYSSIGDLCELSNDTVLLDVCCGTGTIGLTLAQRVNKVIGIDICSQAIEDAKKNAAKNGISNAEYICGKVEDVLPNLLWRVAGQDAVMVVDPPRAGLHSDVVRAIRRSVGIKRLVFVLCKPAAAKANIIDLTREVSKRVTGSSFRLKAAVPVDLFPHTEHYELVLLFDRIDVQQT